MTVMTGKLVSVTGEPFGGPGHAVKIYSRVTRAAQQDDAVILQLVERIPMRSPDDPVEPGDGTFTTADMDPGPIRVELEGSSRHGEGWDINLPEPDGGETESWSLAQLIGLQVEWDPVVVSRAEAAARESTRQAGVAQGHAGVAAEHRAHIDEVVYDVLHHAADMVRDEVKDDAETARTQAGVATEQAGLAGEHRQKAEDAADSAHGAAGAAAEATKTEIRAEMDSKVSEAEGSAQSAGESARVAGEAEVAAEGWAGQSKDAATLAITAAATTSQYVGDGFPEGRVDAPVGAVYTDRQATAGAVRWIKTTGTGNTGWQVEWGDTGWRNINSLTTVRAEGDIHLIRIGNQVTMKFTRFAPTADLSQWGMILAVPSGFRPDTDDIRAIPVNNSAGATDTLWQNYRSGQLRMSNHQDATGVWNMSASWITHDPWPSTLPGVPS